MKTLSKVKKFAFRALTPAILLIAFTPVQAAKLYKWVDSEGRVSYQDRPPPKNAKILSETKLKTSKKPQEDVETDSSSDLLAEGEVLNEQEDRDLNDAKKPEELGARPPKIGRLLKDTGIF